MEQTRRDFLRFLGRTGVSAAGVSIIGPSVLLSACAEGGAAGLPFVPLMPSIQDDLLLPEGFNYHVIVRWEDAINDLEKFGSHNDFTAFMPLKEGDPTDGLLWVNHEYLKPELVHRAWLEEKTLEQVETEIAEVGGSIIRIRKGDDGQWNLVKNDPLNRRFTGQTVIPFAWPEPIAGSNEAIGTLANCAGGITPWGTILTCEENYDQFWGEREHGQEELSMQGYYGWDALGQRPPEHYGWVVEINPLTGEAKKLVALGRCMHEAATIHECEDGRVVAYTGDDTEDEHLYKFISDEPGTLERGKLYVANIERGEWVSLQWDEQPILQEHFANQTEVQVYMRKAAKLVGATPLARPEDIEIDPKTGNVLVALTNNKPKGNYHGEILKIEEGDADKRGLTFKAETFLAGGPEMDFSCPDNMAFDAQGNLWFTSDISGSSVGEGEYAPFGNNGLFFVPTTGEDAGKALRVAVAPMDAEFTGPTFAPDGETLFLCVQHPGETSESMEALTSHWPDGGNEMPRSSVVAIQGEAMKAILGGKA